MTHGWSSFISGHRVSRSTSSSWRCIRLSLASLMHMTGDTLMRYRDMRFPDEKNVSKSFPHSLLVFCVILILYPFPLIHSPNAYSPWVSFSFLFERHKTKRSELIIAILSTKKDRHNVLLQASVMALEEIHKVFIEFRRYFLFHLFQTRRTYGGRETKLQGKEKNLSL